MLESYFKIAIRNLTKRKGYFALNVLGLVVSITCCLLIFHYISYEKSYDSFQLLSGRIVRLRLDIFQNSKQQLQSAAVYPAIAPAMKKEFPEVEDFARLHGATLLLSNDERDIKFNETKGFFADASFLKMFDVKVLRQNSSTPLNEPYQIMLSESMAKKYFPQDARHGNETAIGKILTVRNPSFIQTYLIRGIFKDYPGNSHLSFNYLVSYATYSKILAHYGYPADFAENSWEFRDFYTYLTLKEGADWKKLQAKLPAFCNRYINNREEHRDNNYHDELFLTPLKDIHLHSNYFYEASVNGSSQTVSFLFLIALFIICIAWINYINLATARAVERAKEVGVRKVLGAQRSGLIRQFLVESFLLNAIALIFSIALFYGLADGFDKLTGKEGTAYPMLSINYWIFFGVVFVAGTFLSGIYPAFVLSAFNPVTVLKGFFKHTAEGISLRKALIGVQFIISIGLIASTIIVYQQITYMTRQPLGADINQTLILQGAVSMGDTVYRNAFQSFKNELLQRSDIKNLAASSGIMGKEITWTRNVKRLDIPDAATIPVYHLGIDYDFIPGYNIKIIAGRNFSKQFSTDNKTVLLNETAVQLLGFKNANEAINKKIKRSGDTVTVAGVVANFHQQGLQKQIEPMVFLLMPDARNFYSLKMQSSDMQGDIASIGPVWKKYFPDDPFNYFFLDDAFDQQYKSTNLFEKVFGLFALLAILIASFGLLGLSAYNILQRAKEISIRKILGAKVFNISALLIKDLMRIIAVAFIIATPLVWYVMDKWLEDFAYRINIQWWVFMVAGVIAIFICLTTITFHIIKAAMANPIKNLRSE